MTRKGNPHPKPATVGPGQTAPPALVPRAANGADPPALRGTTRPTPNNRGRPDRRLFCAAATGSDYALLSPSVRHYGYGALQRRASVAGRPRPERGALRELPAPVLTIHDGPHRMCVRHRAAPSTGRDHDLSGRVWREQPQTGQPVALPRRHAHHGKRVAGYAAHRQAPGYHRGYAEILARRRLPSLTAAGLSPCHESFACYLLWEPRW